MKAPPPAQSREVALLRCAPSMGIDLEVEVLSRAGHSERSEPQSVVPRGRREGSGKRSCGPTNRNRIEGGAEQGKRATDREALLTKARRRRSGGRAAKADVLTRGDLALRLKGRRGSQDQRSEKSAEAVLAALAVKGRTMGRVQCSRSSVTACHRSQAHTLSAPPVNAVKPQRLLGVWEGHRRKMKTGAQGLTSTH